MSGYQVADVQQHGDNHDIPNDLRIHKKSLRAGAWLPADHRAHKGWLNERIDQAEKYRKSFIPVLQEFKDFIESDPRRYMYFSAMFEEVPFKHVYQRDPTGHNQIRDYPHMLEVLNPVSGSAPVWTDAQAVGMVVVPMCAILDYPMSTPSGHAAFLDPEVNKMLKKDLNEWGKFLLRPESAGILHENKKGWFGPHGKSDIRFKCSPSSTDRDHRILFSGARCKMVVAFRLFLHQRPSLSLHGGRGILD
ncbi:hypothetical protein LTR41_011863 [Exophiala xenobiotica]|nr:hypothetical protein LTR41_011863 [Exophiala xenobiotica]